MEINREEGSQNDSKDFDTSECTSVYSNVKRLILANTDTSMQRKNKDEGEDSVYNIKNKTFYAEVRVAENNT